MGKTIKITCETRDTVSMGNLTPFQGDLKYLSPANEAKLRAQILKHGITAPFLCTKPGNHILDGHQRLTVLSALASEGYEIPALPCVFVKVSSIDDAKEKLLAITAQYGTITQEGFNLFIDEMEGDYTDILGGLAFDGISLEIGSVIEGSDDLQETTHNDDKEDSPFERGETYGEDSNKNRGIECPECGHSFER